MNHDFIHGGMKIGVFGGIFMRHHHEAWPRTWKDENQYLRRDFHAKEEEGALVRILPSLN
jgi:hypothetical protein